MSQNDTISLIQQIVAGKIGPTEIDDIIISALKKEIDLGDFGPTIFLTEEYFRVKLWDSDGFEIHPSVDYWRQNSPLDFNYFDRYNLGRDYFLYVRKGVDIR